MDARKCWEDLLKTAKCFKCSEIFNEPKTLPCLHSFCLACLDKLARTEGRQHEAEIRCPICQSSIAIPEGNSFVDLRTSFHLNRFKDVIALANGNHRGIKCSNCNEGKTAISYCYICQDYLCWRCDQAHRRLRSTRDHRSVILQNVESVLLKPPVCSHEYHEGKPLDFFCKQCLLCVCRLCHDENHRRHDVVRVEEAADQGKIELKETLVNIEQEISTSKKQMKENSDVFEYRKKDIDAARRNVEEYLNVCIQSLKEHKEAVLTKLDDVHEKQQQRHVTKQTELELFVTQLRSPLDHGKDVLKRNVDVEIMKEGQAVIDRYEDLLNSKQCWEPYQLSFVHYLVDDKIYERVLESGLGRIILSTTDPSQSVAHGVGLRDPLVHKENSFEILTRDSWGKQHYNKHDRIKVKIQSRIGKELKPTLKDEKNGKYQVIFIPESRGKHEVDISVNGQPLTNSPWSIKVTHQYQRVFGLGIDNYEQDRQFRSPCGVTVCQGCGKIAVAVCGFGSNVQIFSPDGKHRISEFGNNRDSTKNLSHPYSVAFGKCSELIVIDYHNMIFCSENGIFESYMERGVFVKRPHSVSVSSDGKLIVCDRGDNEVKVLSTVGRRPILSISSNGKPSFAIHHEDKFFVSYQEEHFVKVFGDDGEFQYNIGAEGCDEEKLSSPLGLAIDRFNNLVVCDTDKRRLQVFKTDGRYVSTVEGGSSQLASPQFVAVSKDGHLIVTDDGTKCVHVFD